MDTKKCSKCLIEKSRKKDFYKAKSKSDGLQPWCKSCVYDNSILDYKVNNRKDVFAERAKSKRKECKAFIDKVKILNGCMICPEKELCCIDFHHMMDKSDNLSSLRMGKNKQAIVDEILKCATICTNCHRKIHAGILDEPKRTLTLSDLIRCGINEFVVL